jgi:hypothetical protein
MTIFDLLHKHHKIFTLGKYWQFTDSQIQINYNGLNYLVIGRDKIDLFGIDMRPKLSNRNSDDWNFFKEYFSFINQIKKNIIKLNHLGFGYPITNFDLELEAFKQKFPPGFELVEEDSGEAETNRWFFIKHKTDSLVTKIELVLHLNDKYQEYYPQFQLDIDTNLSFAAITNITDALFGKDFFFWKYNIPNYGVVMAMAKIGQINGIKILLGIGTNLRKSQAFK